MILKEKIRQTPPVLEYLACLSKLDKAVETLRQGRGISLGNPDVWSFALRGIGEYEKGQWLAETDDDEELDHVDLQGLAPNGSRLRSQRRLTRWRRAPPGISKTMPREKVRRLIRGIARMYALSCPTREVWALCDALCETSTGERYFAPGYIFFDELLDDAMEPAKGDTVAAVRISDLLGIFGNKLALVEYARFGILAGDCLNFLFEPRGAIPNFCSAWRKQFARTPVLRGVSPSSIRPFKVFGAYGEEDSKLSWRRKFAHRENLSASVAASLIRHRERMLRRQANELMKSISFFLKSTLCPWVEKLDPGMKIKFAEAEELVDINRRDKANKEYIRELSFVSNDDVFCSDSKGLRYIEVSALRAMRGSMMEEAPDDQDQYQDFLAFALEAEFSGDFHSRNFTEAPKIGRTLLDGARKNKVQAGAIYRNRSGLTRIQR